MEKTEMELAVSPLVTFRGLLPQEGLLSLAREQDALVRSVGELDGTETQLWLVQRQLGSFRSVRAEVSAEVSGMPVRGSAEHSDASAATRLAFSALLRAAAEERGPAQAAGALAA
jgi:hypothetical protein